MTSSRIVSVGKIAYGKISGHLGNGKSKYTFPKSAVLVDMELENREVGLKGNIEFWENVILCRLFEGCSEGRIGE